MKRVLAFGAHPDDVEYQCAGTLALLAKRGCEIHIASMTGGSPYLATDTRALAQRFQNILEELEKSRIRDRGVLYAELYPRFLWPAFAVLLLEIALRLSRLQQVLQQQGHGVSVAPLTPRFFTS